MKILFLLPVLIYLSLMNTAPATGINGDKPCPVLYSTSGHNEYLELLSETYNIPGVNDTHNTDLDLALEILHWTNKQWEHDGSTQASSDDAFEILEEAAEGHGFRCTEYAIVYAAAANSSGLVSRRIDLKTRDCETAESGAGHSAAEVFIKDFDKWVFVDPQNDVVAFKDSIPLNALEFRESIEENPGSIKILYKGEWVPENFAAQVINWIYPYLYFLEIPFDNRYGRNEIYLCNDKAKLMLVPVGAQAPAVFQQRYALDNYIETKNSSLFYSAPE